MKEKTKATYQERILRVLLYIQSNLYEPLELEELAQVAHFSPYHFHRVFRGMVGEPVAEYVRRLRLQNAAGMLKHANRSITELAFESGYESVESFIRAFREQFGVNPGQYKKENGFKRFTINEIFNEQKGAIQMNVEVMNVPPRRVAFVRHTGPYDQCGQAWETLCMWAGPRGLLQPGAQFIGQCYDDPDVTEPAKIRYDACITVDEQCSTEGPVGIQVLEGGLFAKTTHHGAYSQLNQTYATLCGQWAPANGYELRPVPGFEIYLNSPEETPEEDLLTDIYVPVEES